MAARKHKHRPCPCGCGELADECMRPESALNAFSIEGHPMSADDQREQRGLDLDELAEVAHEMRHGIWRAEHDTQALRALPDLIAAARERDRLQDLVAEFRKREETQDRIRERLTHERDELRAKVEAVRALAKASHRARCGDEFTGGYCRGCELLSTLGGPAVTAPGPLARKLAEAEAERDAAVAELTKHRADMRQARIEAMDCIHGKDRAGGLDGRFAGPLGLVRALVAQVDPVVKQNIDLIEAAHELSAERDRYAEALVNLAHPHGYGPLCEPEKYVACAAARLVAERAR